MTASSKDVGSATLQESRNAKRQKIKNWVFETVVHITME